MLLGHGGSDWGVTGAVLLPSDPHAHRLSPDLAPASRSSRDSLVRTGPCGMQAAPGPGLEGVGRAGRLGRFSAAASDGDFVPSRNDLEPSPA